MRTYNFYYESALTFHLLPLDKINEARHILVQIYSGNCAQSFLKKIVGEIKIFFPNAIIIGATTDGEIKNFKISTHRTVIALTTFDCTSITSCMIENIKSENSFASGFAMAKKIVKRNTKLLILFTDGLEMNGEDFVKGIESKAPNIEICGAMAGDNAKFYETFVIHNEEVKSGAAVGVALSSRHLHVTTDCMLDWDAVGPTLEITKSRQNRVYEINHQKVFDVYRHYFGDELMQKLPRIGSEIPLVSKDRNGILISRSVISVGKDDSLLYSGNLKKGEQYRFGYADCSKIKEKSQDLIQNFDNKEVESFFIYASMARRRSFGEIVNKEIEPFADAAKVSGFFSYGEFFHKEKTNYLLNQSFSVVGLSESKAQLQIDPYARVFDQATVDSEYELQQAFTHMMKVTNDDCKKKEDDIGRMLEYLPLGMVRYDRHLHIVSFNSKGLISLSIDKAVQSGMRDMKSFMDISILTILEKGLTQEIYEELPGSGYYIKITPFEIKDSEAGAVAIIGKRDILR